MATEPSVHVELTRSIDSWLRQAGIEDPKKAASLAVDLADLLHAANEVRILVKDLLATGLNEPADADRALQLAADIEVQLFTELKHHLAGLERSWPGVLKKLEKLGRARTG